MSEQLDGAFKRKLVEQAEAIAEKAARQGKSDQRQASQIRNMMQICQVETEPAVLKNFIRYQAARKSTQGLWKNIADHVIKELDAIADATPDNPDKRRVALLAFFGYMVRCYVYLTAEKSQND